MTTPDKSSPAFINPNPGHCRTCAVELANKRHQYCTSCRPLKGPPQRRTRATRVAGAHADGGPMAVVREIAPQRPTGANAAAAPSTREWDDGLGKAVVGMTWALGLRMTRGEPREIRYTLATELAMNDDEATAIVHPIAVRFSGTSLNRKFGRGILETLTLAEPFMAMMQYLDRVHEYQFERDRRAEGAPAPGLRSVPTMPAPAGPVHVPPTHRADPEQGSNTNDREGEEQQGLPPGVPPITGYTGGPFGAGI